MGFLRLGPPRKSLAPGPTSFPIMEPVKPVTSVVLYGPDHTDYGEIATRVVSDHAAIAISIGKYPKGYPAFDPNEDGAFAASNGTSTLLAVVDGHNGFDTAAATLDAIHRKAPQALSSGVVDPKRTLVDLTAEARAAVAQRLSSAPEERRNSRTALALALVTGGSATTLVIGDAVALTVRGRRARRLRSSPSFFGPETEIDHAAVSRVRLKTSHKLVLASDGLFDFLGPEWRSSVIAAANHAEPRIIAQRLVEAAFAGGAGDNVAVALCSH